MSAPSASLRELFLAKYQDFRKRLRIRLGSEDLANEAMQETWLRVESMPDAAPVEYPAAYLFKIAVNVAEDQRRGSARLLSMEELEELYELADEAAGPVREVEGRQQLAALEAALAELPRRRQAIVIAARVDEVPHREIAERFGISVRTVEKELRAGLEHCCRKLEKSMSNASVPGPANRLRDMAAMFTARISSSLRREARPVLRLASGQATEADGAAFRQWCGQSVEHARAFKETRAAGRRCSRPPGARAPSRWRAREPGRRGGAPSWGRTGLRRLSGVPAAAGPVAGGERAGRRLSQRRRRTAGGGAGRGRHRADEHPHPHQCIRAGAGRTGGPAGWRGRAARRRAAGQPVGGRRQRDGARRLRQRALHGRPGARDLPGGVARVRGPGGELALAAPRQVLLGADGLGRRATPIWPPSAVGGAACWSSTTCRWRRSWTRSTATARAASC